MLYYVYVLQSVRFKKLYIGFTSDILNRLKKHNNGLSQATKPYIPYNLIFYKAFISIKDAKNREKYLKTGWGLRSLKKMLCNSFLT
mgnify:CR=1 FL=1